MSTGRLRANGALRKWNNPNAAAVARQFGFGETTILTLCNIGEVRYFDAAGYEGRTVGLGVPPAAKQQLAN